MQSLPSRERGLKFVYVLQIGYERIVAPLAGAWIEIGCKVHAGSGRNVAPLAGAWIEMYWMGVLAKCQTRSLPSRERGLKCPV